MTIRLYLDEDVDPLLAQVLRDRGIDCLATHQANNHGLSDSDQLAFAATQKRTILTFNVKDFVKLAREYAGSNRPIFPSASFFGAFSSCSFVMPMKTFPTSFYGFKIIRNLKLPEAVGKRPLT